MDTIYGPDHVQIAIPEPGSKHHVLYVRVQMQFLSSKEVYTLSSISLHVLSQNRMNPFLCVAV